MEASPGTTESLGPEVLQATAFWKRRENRFPYALFRVPISSVLQIFEEKEGFCVSDQSNNNETKIIDALFSDSATADKSPGLPEDGITAPGHGRYQRQKRLPRKQSPWDW